MTSTQNTTPATTSTSLGTVVLGTTSYDVTEISFGPYTDSITGRLVTDLPSEIHLEGPRGATYFLRAYNERNGDSGLRQVISWKSGQPLRRKGNEVRVIRIGDVLEVA